MWIVAAIAMGIAGLTSDRVSPELPKLSRLQQRVSLATEVLGEKKAGFELGRSTEREVILIGQWLQEDRIALAIATQSPRDHTLALDNYQQLLHDLFAKHRRLFEEGHGSLMTIALINRSLARLDLERAAHLGCRPLIGPRTRAFRRAADAYAIEVLGYYEQGKITASETLNAITQAYSHASDSLTRDILRGHVIQIEKELQRSVRSTGHQALSPRDQCLYMIYLIKLSAPLNGLEGFETDRLRVAFPTLMNYFAALQAGWIRTYLIDLIVDLNVGISVVASPKLGRRSVCDEIEARTRFVLMLKDLQACLIGGLYSPRKYGIVFQDGDDLLLRYWILRAEDQLAASEGR